MSVKQHLVLFASITAIVLVVSVPVAATGGEPVDDVNGMEIVTTIIEWFAILLEQAAKNMRAGLELLTESTGSE